MFSCLPVDAKCCNERRFNTLKNTKSHFRPGIPHPLDAFGVSILGAYGASQLDAFGVSARRLDPMCPSTSIECPPNEFCWRRA